MEIREELSHKLLDNSSKKCTLDIETYKQRALTYSQMEGSVSVLSDMQANKSYIYKSMAAVELGLSLNENPAEIDTIWEEEMLMKIHPDDRVKKYIHELRFFKLLNSIQQEQRPDYSVLSKIRMKDKNDEYKWVKHRMFYMYSPDNGRLRFALCLYNISLTQSVASDFLIINTIKGEVVVKDKLDYKNILSPRELEVLKFVGEGYASKQIADLLSISINTVSRHRQNILEKLKVKNSTQAFKDSFH
ncbi:LuxR family transcriptional regulator [Chryseobacterium lactis]|uniref:LuxR family transcriptional regulator n=1 Tax=Chryseobacterium lactis TaxID=1241981 RepID=A0A3G6RIJ9_CHRLC|nr:helix-turn-helix transcriptional regulator [Chryseobacterium lactis]AZA83308.1 LuxR family transcriptional regulator [Chryseobacterium lactis]AZB03693.1 LuxR family transcriptional regulator [Chryseobacterium lactis]PNW11099.1 LuxR family transcriptional regulator [Chryseobacterium lactis]